MSAEAFYSELPSHQDFDTGNLHDDFVPVPEDWVVVAADIVRSRDAINDGRYKQVNMVGAAVIAAVLNELGQDQVPFVFGGDGAVLVVPASQAEAAAVAVSGVVSLAREVMQLELRGAAIPVADIRRQGGDVRIRKYQLSPGNHLAMIVGDGLLIADRILKDPDAVRPFALKETVRAPVLDGLSCRWDPLPAQNGRIVSLILKPTGNVLLSDVLEEVSGAIGINPYRDDEKIRLAEKPRLRFRFPPRGLGLEVRFTSHGHRLKGYLMGIFESLVFLYGYTTGRRFGPFEPKKYIKELGLNTDHRKLGDSLQLVLDLSVAQLSALEVLLEKLADEGRAVYGLHVSDAAIMTCFLQDLEHNKHIHFIDGSGGGLSMAATDFKARIAALGEDNPSYAPIA